jgi:uncharacterized protein
MIRCQGRYARRVLAGVLAAALGACAAGHPRAPETPGGLASGAAPTYTLVTGPRGGAYDDFGRTLLRPADDGSTVPWTTRSSHGAADSLTLLARGDAQAAIVNLGTAQEAWTASGPWAGMRPMTDLRVLMPAYAIVFHLVTLADSGVATIRDLDRKRVGIAVGPSKEPSELFFRTLAGNLGIAPTLVVETPSLLVGPLLARTLDAIWVSGETPNPTLVELGRKSRLRLVSLNADDVAGLTRQYPGLSAFALPAGSYDRQTEPVRTVALWNYVVATAALPDRAAYDFVDAALRRSRIVAGAVAAAPDATGTPAGAFLPWHSGALRRYREARPR